MYNNCGDVSVNDEITFKTKDELYNRIKPALYSKTKELINLGYKYITEKDIWNYLVENEWKEKSELELHSLVSDILFINNDKLNEYVMKKNKSKNEFNDSIL